MGVLWEDRAWEDYCWWQTQDRKTLRRINAMIRDIQRERYGGIGHPEALKGSHSGWWSRRIDDANRIVYREKDGTIIIAACRGHYEDN